MRHRADFRQLFELQPVPSWLLDDSGRTLLANAQARALLAGIDPRVDLPPDPWQLLSLLSPKDRVRLRGALSETGPPVPVRLDELWLRDPAMAACLSMPWSGASTRAAAAPIAAQACCCSCSSARSHPAWSCRATR